MRNIHWQSIEAYRTLIKAASDFSFERALGTVFYVAGTISSKGHDIFTRRHHMGEHLLGTALGYEGHAQIVLSKWKEDHKEFIILLDTMRNYILDNRQTERDLMKGIIWYRRSDYYVKTIYWLGEEVLHGARNKLDKDGANYSKYIATNCVIFTFTGALLMPLIVQMARKTSKTLTGYTLVMEKKSLEVTKEKRKTENVLNQMLPRAVSTK